MSDSLNRPGDEDLVDSSELMTQVYDELRRLARRKMRPRRPGATLQTTALVHEAWMKVVGGQPDREVSREHFLALASTAMRHVLATYAQSRAAIKRGRGWRRVTLSGAVGQSEQGVDLAAVSEALEELLELNPRHGRLAELRVLSGMTMPECANVMELSLATIEREWRLVRAWLGARLVEGE